MRSPLIPLLVLAGALPLMAQEASPADPLRDTVRGAIEWIARQAVPMNGVDGAIAFPASEGSKQAPQTIVYGGSAGVLIFLENAAAVLDDQAARDLADRTAKGLRSARTVNSRDLASWSPGGMMGVTGLYTGDAGIGQAFLVRHVLRGDADALAVAVDVGEALLARAREDDGALSWGEQPDIIFGNAGTALFLLELGLVSKTGRFVDAARRAGHGLLAAAVRVPSKADAERQLPTWVLTMGRRQIHMPNFSHGTAGVAYALVRLGAETGDAELLQAGKDGAEWLLENAVVDGDGLKWMHSDRSKDRYMGGWCHGPVGTGRLFLLLHAVTGDARYLDAARKGARFVVAYAADAEKTGVDGQKPYVPPSLCCGVAGVVDFFCDLTRVTHDPADAAFAHKAGDYLVDVAIADGDGRKWKNGQSVPGGPVAADSTGHNVDLMLGAAGEALALLRLMTIEREADPVRSLPDRTVTAPAWPKK
jgi:lantibiotic modifying enzyme